MDMEHELRALRIQIRDKCTISFKLQKEVCSALLFCFCFSLTYFLDFWLQLGEKGYLDLYIPSFWTYLQLAMNKRAEENKFRLYDINGSETLGSILRVQPCSDDAVELSKCSVQWYRISSECSRREPIVGIFTNSKILKFI